MRAVRPPPHSRWLWGARRPSPQKAPTTQHTARFLRTLLLHDSEKWSDCFCSCQPGLGDQTGKALCTLSDSVLASHAVRQWVTEAVAVWDSPGNPQALR